MARLSARQLDALEQCASVAHAELVEFRPNTIESVLNANLMVRTSDGYFQITPAGVAVLTKTRPTARVYDQPTAAGQRIRNRFTGCTGRVRMIGVVYDGTTSVTMDGDNGSSLGGHVHAFQLIDDGPQRAEFETDDLLRNPTTGVTFRVVEWTHAVIVRNTETGRRSAIPAEMAREYERVTEQNADRENELCPPVCEHGKTAAEVCDQTPCAPERHTLYVESVQTRAAFVFEGTEYLTGLGVIVHLRTLDGMLTARTLNHFTENFQALCVHLNDRHGRGCPSCGADEHPEAQDYAVARGPRPDTTKLGYVPTDKITRNQRVAVLRWDAARHVDRLHFGTVTAHGNRSAEQPETNSIYVSLDSGITLYTNRVVGIISIGERYDSKSLTELREQLAHLLGKYDRSKMIPAAEIRAALRDTR